MSNSEPLDESSAKPSVEIRGGDRLSDVFANPFLDPFLGGAFFTPENPDEDEPEDDE